MQPAYVLHRWPYQDSSLLVELFTLQHGRFRVIAKGAKRPKSRWRSILQPFTPLLVETRGKHELQTLVDAEASAPAFALQGVNLYSGFYLNELLQRLTSIYQPLDGVFDDYQQALQLLTQMAQIEPVLRRFEWQLLCHLGHGFDWFYDTQQQPVVANSHYLFVPEAGFSAVSATPHSYAGSDLLKLAAFELNDSRLLNVFKRLMREALAPYLGPTPLRSRELFIQLQVASSTANQPVVAPLSTETPKGYTS